MIDIFCFSSILSCLLSFSEYCEWMLHEKPQASFLLEMDLAVCPESYVYHYNKTHSPPVISIVQYLSSNHHGPLTEPTYVEESKQPSRSSDRANICWGEQATITVLWQSQHMLSRASNHHGHLTELTHLAQSKQKSRSSDRRQHMCCARTVFTAPSIF